MMFSERLEYGNYAFQHLQGALRCAVAAVPTGTKFIFLSDVRLTITVSGLRWWAPAFPKTRYGFKCGFNMFVVVAPLTFISWFQSKNLDPTSAL